MDDYLFAPETTHTDSFLLRSWMPGDGPALSDATNSSYAHLKRFMPWAVPDQSNERSERLCREFRGRYLLGSNFVLGVWDPTDSRVLGGCGFHLREGGLHTATAEVGMWIRASEAGRGLGTAVLVELIRWGFSDWPWLRLVWKCDAENRASRRVAEKAGMSLEGVSRGEYSATSKGRRDGCRYAILRG